jgi:outer membrane protein assembly factor BamB
VVVVPDGTRDANLVDVGKRQGVCLVSLDDVVNVNRSEFTILKGKTGQNLVARATNWPEFSGALVYWGVPIAGDFEGTGRTGVFFGTGNRSLTGLLRGDGSLAWSDARDKATTCLPAFGDFTGSGRREVIGIGFEDGIRCYDAATGQVLWRLTNPAEGVASETASADINGDGRSEMLFTAGTRLYCVGTIVQNGKKAGAILWKCELPTQVGPPVIADVEGRGTASILLVGADGWVYCLQ